MTNPETDRPAVVPPPMSRAAKAEALLLGFAAEAHRRKWSYDRGLDDDGVPVPSDGFMALHRLGEDMRVALEELRRTPAAVSVPPPAPRADDQAALRDRIAKALAGTELKPPFPHCLAAADAVLAVLPEPADRAAVLREAADDLATAFGDPMAKHIGALGAAHLRRRAREIEAGQTTEGQPETPLEKRLRYSERRNDELRTECKRRGKTVLEQSEKIIALEREIDEVRRQLGAEILRAGQAEAELRRLADEAQQSETLCGRTTGVTRTEYPPCARSAGHPEAYCRSADGKQHFLALYGPRPATSGPCVAGEQQNETPEAVSRPTRYEVNLVPETDDPGGIYAITVEYRGDNRWAVLRHSLCLSLDGQWDRERNSSEREEEWLDAHRFDLDTALRLAEEQAVDIAPAKWSGRDRKPQHVGGRVNAEDCPACHGTNPPYPFICPGPSAVEEPA